MSEASGSAILAGNPAPVQDAGNMSGTPVTAVQDAPATAANAAWYDSIQDSDLKGYVQNKGWSDPADLAVGYRNLEKLLGGEKIPMPKGQDDAEGWQRVYDALGRPKSAEDYKLSVPDGFDPGFATEAAQQFHKLGLSAQQAQALTEWFNGTQTGAVEAFQQQAAAQAETEIQDLRREWGGAWEENVELGRRAAREFGLSDEKLSAIESALGTGEMLKFMSRVGRGLVEHNFESGRGTQGFGMTPDAARQRVAALRQDAGWSAKYLSGDADARAEMAKLMQLAFPE